MSDMSFNNGSISSIIRQNQHIELSSKQSLVKALRSATGQFKLSNTSVVNQTLTTDSEFGFSLKKGTNYILTADLNFRVGGAAGPVGGLQIEFVAPANSTISAMDGTIIYTSNANVTITALGSATDTPYTGMVKGLNTAITLDNSSTSDGFSNARVFALLQPSVDDYLTFQFAQVATSAGHGTVLLAGSSMKLLALSGSRRSPNVV